MTEEIKYVYRHPCYTCRYMHGESQAGLALCTYHKSGRIINLKIDFIFCEHAEEKK